MSLLAGYSDLLNKLPPTAEPETIIPPDIGLLAKEIQFVNSRAAAELFLQNIQCIPIRAISIDSEYSFSKPTIILRSGRYWNDIRSQKPILLSLTVWAEKRGDTKKSYFINAVFDLRRLEVLSVIDNILRLRIQFVFHNMKAELFTFWSLGFNPHFHNFYDTYVAAACIDLGLHHPRGGNLDFDEYDSDEIALANKAAEKRESLLSLNGQCRKYGLKHPFENTKVALQKSFLNLGAEEYVTQEQKKYAAADAEITLRLYVKQLSEVIRLGLSSHLHTVEFPYAVSNARIEWEGVQLSHEQMGKLKFGCEKASEHFANELKTQGLSNPGSRKQFISLMCKCDLLHLFTKRTKKGQTSTNKDVLEQLNDIHPAIRAFRLHQKYKGIANQEWLSGCYVGDDGRHHPNHKQLGAHTGRNTCSSPNITGIGKIFRPIVVAPLGKVIIELDYSQIEPGIAGAEYNDVNMIAAYNSGDVYSFAAQKFYEKNLPQSEQTLSTSQFKMKFPALRNNMKVFVLAILYNAQPPLIAARFGISLREATIQREQFLDLFPVLKRALTESSIFGSHRRYASTVTGLRRNIEDPHFTSPWAVNFLRNTPIQGSAAVVFKRAVNALFSEFFGTEVKIILTIYDAVVIECPVHLVTEVALLAESIMKSQLKHLYPQLIPQVDVNSKHTACWNKDGCFDSLDKFLEDSTFRIERETNISNNQEEKK